MSITKADYNNFKFFYTKINLQFKKRLQPCGRGALPIVCPIF